MKNLSKNKIMKTSKLLSIFSLGVISMACSENKKDTNIDKEINETNKTLTVEYSALNDDVLSNYLELKNALIEDNEDATSTAAKKLVTALNDYNADSPTTELSGNIVSAIKNAENIAVSNIKQQREAFLSLSTDMINLVEKTGTNTKLYQQYCPMYGEAGGSWLSSQKEVKNPYFGAKMINCGQVKKEYN